MAAAAVKTASETVIPAIVNMPLRFIPNASSIKFDVFTFFAAIHYDNGRLPPLRQT
jgi:hypothetical protein